MKSSQTGKAILSNSFNSRSKKGAKDREKRKSPNSTDVGAKDKSSPSKDNKQYAGISADFISSINIYTEYLSDEVRETLAEDINYRLRHIIHDALIKARLSGRNVINHKDIDETFKNLSIENVYGATSSPNWVPLADHNILYLDDAKLNLVEIAEEENNYAQHGDMPLNKAWFPNLDTDTASPLLKNYFVKSCYATINSDDNVRIEALKDISENPNIGPIVDWFYNFAYFLLLKDITYDCLTLNALNLVETLENSVIGNHNASDKQLNLLVRLLLQRLIFSKTNNNTIKPMCSILALLCLRYPLKKMAIAKLNHKLAGIQKLNLLPVLTAIYFLGVEAVQQIFIPNIDYFLGCVSDLGCPDMIFMAQALYSLVCRAGCFDTNVHHCFYWKFSYMLLPFWKQNHCKSVVEDTHKDEITFSLTKLQLLRTRRRMEVLSGCANIIKIEKVFELPPNNCIVGKKLEEHNRVFHNYKRETYAVVGKTRILLPVMRRNKHKISLKCSGHNMLSNI